MYQWLQRLFSGPAPLCGADPGPPAHPPPDPAPAGHPPAAVVHARISFDQRDRIDNSYQHWLFGAGDGSDLDTSPLETEVLDALSTILKSQQSGAALVRRLPGLIPQLLQSLRSDSFSGAQLARTISHDVVLVAAVIRLANSSFQGSGKTITSVEHAVMVIGHKGLRHLITSVAFRPIIDLNSGHFIKSLAPRIWDQSERCAVANRMLAEARGIDPFEAFLAGLVQNVGLIVTLRIMDQAAKGDRDMGSEMFCARLVRDARILTCSIGREWNFPEAVTVAIGEQGDMSRDSTMSPLGQLLMTSDYLSKVRILAEHQRVAESDAQLFQGLGADALACYHALDAIGAGEAADEHSGSAVP